MTTTIFCKCGAVIPDDQIEHWNTGNELGEDVGMVSAYCNECGREYEAGQWGHWDDRKEAIETLIDWTELEATT